MPTVPGGFGGGLAKGGSIISWVTGGMSSGVDRALIYSGNVACPNESLPPEMYTRMFRNGIITFGIYANHMRDLGYDVSQIGAYRKRYIYDPDGVVIPSPRIFDNISNVVARSVLWDKNLITGDQALLMLNRGLISDSTALDILTTEMDGEADLAFEYRKLRYQIPGPSDLVHFAVREAFDSNVILAFEYNKELPDAIRPWMEAQGLGGQIAPSLPPGSTDTNGNPLDRPTYWFDMYWFSHWQLPSAGQGYQMLHRFYPASRYGPSPETNPNTVFRPADLNLLLKTNDYPPYWRTRLEALSFSPLTRVDIRRMYSVGVINNAAELYHAYRAIGYNDVNAERLKDFTVALERKKAFRELKPATEKMLFDLFFNDVINEGELRQQLALIYLKPEEIEATIGRNRYYQQRRYLTAQKKQIRRAYLAGMLDVNQCRTALSNLGMTGVYTDKDLAIWTMELFAGGKHIGASKAITLYVKGLLGEQKLVIRLFNLGYTQEETTLLLSEAKQTIYQQGLALAEKLAKAVEQEQKKTQAQLDKIRSKELAAFTDKNILAYFKAGYLSVESIAAIHKEIGWNDAAIAAYTLTYLTGV